MSSVVFTLLFGMLSGIAGFVGRAPCFEIVLGLGLLGLAHLSLVAARRADPPLLGKRVER